MDLVPPDLTDLTRQHFLEFTEPSGSGIRVELCGGHLVTCQCMTGSWRFVEYRYLEIETVLVD